MAQLMSYLLRAGGGGDETSERSPATDQSHIVINDYQVNPDTVSLPLLIRYRNARAHDMYNDLDLRAYKKMVMGDRVAKSLNTNYRTLLARPETIAKWANTTRIRYGRPECAGDAQLNSVLGNESGRCKYEHRSRPDAIRWVFRTCCSCTCATRSTSNWFGTPNTNNTTTITNTTVATL